MSLSPESLIPSTLLRSSPVMGVLDEFFSSNGLEAYVVGGIVRDALLGRESKDIDIGLVADVHSISQRLASVLRGKLVQLDESRGIVRIVVQDQGNVKFVDLNTIHDNIEQDLERRDFTLDAMALRLGNTVSIQSHKDIIDPHCGLLDLKDGVIRALSPDVFEKDPVRLMRAPRLSAQLGFKINGNTADLIRAHAFRITKVSPERIRDELLQLLEVPNATAALRCLDDLELLCYIIPELAQSKNVTQPKEHHWDVFNHMLETAGQVEAVISGSASYSSFATDIVPKFQDMNEYFREEVSDGHSRLTLIKLTGLIHDIAKPATKSVDSSGRVRFLGHHTEGADVADRILKRLRVSRRGMELVRLMVQNHLRPAQMAQPGELPTGKAIYRYFRDVGDAAIDTLYLNMADYLGARGPDLGRQEWVDYCSVIEHILLEGTRQEKPKALPRLLDGHDIMDTFSIGPGPEVGSLLELVEEAYSGGEVSTREGALNLVRNSLELRG